LNKKLSGNGGVKKNTAKEIFPCWILCRGI
jgi:hypothetical protein